MLSVTIHGGKGSFGPRNLDRSIFSISNTSTRVLPISETPFYGLLEPSFVCSLAISNGSWKDWKSGSELAAEGFGFVWKANTGYRRSF